MFLFVFAGEKWRGGLVGGRGRVEDGAVPVGGHHGPRAAVPAGRYLAAFSGRHHQLEGVQLHTGKRALCCSAYPTERRG